ncbi:MAG: hypothetical protein QXU18_14815 [Thermoplasmatales archaeon]
MATLITTSAKLIIAKHIADGKGYIALDTDYIFVNPVIASNLCKIDYLPKV